VTETRQEAARGPGRPRSARADVAIVDATITALLEGGYAGLSIEGVADAAGVGKTTIYRRFPGKAELVIAALEAAGNLPNADPPDTGSLVGDVKVLLGTMLAINQNDPRRLLAMPRLTAEAGATDLALFEAIRERLVDPRRTLLKGVLRKAADRGELASDVDVDLLADAMMGSFVFYLLRTGGRPDDPVGRILDTLEMFIDGIGPGRTMSP
jgi:AcrR family transcriptional regulator